MRREPATIGFRAALTAFFLLTIAFPLVAGAEVLHEEDFEPTFAGQHWVFPDSDTSPRRLITMTVTRQGVGAMELSENSAPVARYTLTTPLSEGWVEIWIGTGPSLASEIVLGAGGSETVRFGPMCPDTTSNLILRLEGEAATPAPGRMPAAGEGWHRVVIERGASEVLVHYDGRAIVRADHTGPAWDTLTLRVDPACDGRGARYDGLRIGAGEVPGDVAERDPDFDGPVDYGPGTTTIELAVLAGRLDANESFEYPGATEGFPTNPIGASLRVSRRSMRAFALGVAATVSKTDLLDRVVTVSIEGLAFHPSRYVFAGFGVGYAQLGDSGTVLAANRRNNGLAFTGIVGIERPYAGFNLGLRLEAQYLDAGPFASLVGLSAAVHLGYDFHP